MLEILRANIEDATEITAIKTTAYNKEINTYLGRDGGPPGYNQVESQLHIINNFIAYKILIDNRIIGAFFLIPIDEATMRFEDFVIHPLYQNKGYGYQTMVLTEKTYPNITQWQLSTPVFSVGNQHLYKKFGYIEVSRDQELIEYIKTITK
ncbi:GNAT family N-acetyltransferase [Paludicola sp. MB14-C6]|uniref:GNAT family N-acetyltransferase n=1 Tax=Paludihabitans sp. MB14-C6 TaxID=3070656 RepID=UPI0027DD1D6E|nr:GNAT family N-acetyltransferase [Paludicola sp. MB14-C6]WMJ22851.1 GNAT family N-acetyltransferase [Paludicola sp. MB14-C6]